MIKVIWSEFKRMLPRKAYSWQNKWLTKGEFWRDAPEQRWMFIKSAFRMRMRKLWSYDNAAPISSRWSGHFAKYWDGNG